MPEYLNAIKYNRHFPRKVVYGHTDKGGLGITKLYTMQGIKQIETLLLTLRNNDESSHLLHISAQLLQLEAGTSKPILSFPITNLDHLTPTWLTSLWRLCILHDITIYIYISQTSHCKTIKERMIET